MLNIGIRIILMILETKKQNNFDKGKRSMVLLKMYLYVYTTYPTDI